MKACCGGKRLQICFVVQAICMVCLVGFVFSPPRPYAQPTCDCHYGVVERENPRCQCVCFGDYLLPNCLYTAIDVVDVELWLTTKSGKKRGNAYPLSSGDIERGLDRLFGHKNSSGLFKFRRGTSSFSSEGLVNSSIRSGKFYVAAVVSMPGWAAQHLLAYVAQKAGKGGEMTNSASGVSYTLYAAYDMAKGPPLPVMYYYESMAFFTGIDSNIFITAADCGWMFGAIVLVLLMTRIEQLWMYSIVAGLGAISRRSRGDEKGSLFLNEDGAGSSNVSRHDSLRRSSSKGSSSMKSSSKDKKKNKKADKEKKRNNSKRSRASGKRAASKSERRAPDSEAPQLGERRSKSPAGENPGGAQWRNPLTI
ncbi:hypothetical protein DPX39_080040200 [Trypanosoma brucei equiperdum]|uniref:Uncharacterized protein n=2 Tax=Trypanosoma brucei TaxID=5691 RepID=A0A3L6L4F5_9TRYP|nr:hypothetical protein DPX39_080040200 [Trypanosoma brucei equiperdum]